MKFTPLDVRHQEFPSRFGGYDRASVRNFLSDLSQDFEELLQALEAQREYLAGLERELEERKQSEDEVRRAVVAAERIGHELRENAARESDLMVAQASTHRDSILREAEAKNSELEARHQARVASLEAAFRNRFAELERNYHQLTLERDRVQAERLQQLEQAFTERHSDLTTRLVAVRQEYAQFMGSYRALMTSFSEMARSHLVLDDSALPAQRLPTHQLANSPGQTPLPPMANTPTSPSPDAPPEPQAPAPEVQAHSAPQEDETPPARVEGQQFL